MFLLFCYLPVLPRFESTVCLLFSGAQYVWRISRPAKLFDLFHVFIHSIRHASMIGWVVPLHVHLVLNQSIPHFFCPMTCTDDLYLSCYMKINLPLWGQLSAICDKHLDLWIKLTCYYVQQHYHLNLISTCFQNLFISSYFIVLQQFYSPGECYLVSSYSLKRSNVLCAKSSAKPVCWHYLLGVCRLWSALLIFKMFGSAG